MNIHSSHEMVRSRFTTTICCKKCSYVTDHPEGVKMLGKPCVPDPQDQWTDGIPYDPPTDDVNHPSHYTAYKGLEIIQLTEQMNFNRGNAVKYIARAGLKNPDDEIKDLEKAKWYIQREIDRLSTSGD